MDRPLQTQNHIIIIQHTRGQLRGVTQEDSLHYIHGQNSACIRHFPKSVYILHMRIAFPDNAQGIIIIIILHK